MAKLSSFRADTKAIQDGIWVRVNDVQFEDIEICTRGFTDKFIDAQNARLAKAAVGFGGDQNQIPNGVRREINGTLLREFLVLDVRNLLDDENDNRPVTKDEFLAMLTDPQWYKLSQACFVAASRVTNLSAEQVKAAVGNFDGASPGA